MVERRDIKAACSGCRILLIASQHRFSRTIEKNFPGTDSRVISQQFEQSLVRPFLFHKGIMTPFRQSSRIISVCQIIEKRVWRNRSIVRPAYLSSLELKPQIPVTLLFLSLLTAFLISEGLKGSSRGKICFISLTAGLGETNTWRDRQAGIIWERAEVAHQLLKTGIFVR